MLKPIFCLMGPTAAGKTKMACELINNFPFEVISVDSAMIYREMNIGTAKPTAQELRAVPHHLIDILDPLDSYSVAQFCEDAMRLCDAIYRRDNIPLLIGGTTMYFQALQQGLSSLPPANKTIRAELAQQAEFYGWTYLHQQLTQVDPESAVRIHPNDTQRIQRALEVYQLMGKPLSSFWSEKIKNTAEYRFINLILLPEERAWLHTRIALRFEQMLEQGFVYEVAELLQKWHLSATCPAMRSVGYRQVINYLAGDYDYDTLRHKGIVATRQLAKRQMTWLRHWPQALIFSCENLQTKTEMMAIIKEILDNPKSEF